MDQLTVEHTPMYGTKIESAYASASSGNCIECNVIRLDRGWRVEVLLPRRVSDSDARKMLQWLEDYRSEIRRQHPYWLHGIRTTARGYALDIEPAEGPKDMISRALPFLQSQRQLGLGHG